MNEMLWLSAFACLTDLEILLSLLKYLLIAVEAVLRVQVVAFLIFTWYPLLQMMQNLLLEEGGLVQVESVNLMVATYSKFQPQSPDFLDITNPKAV